MQEERKKERKKSGKPGQFSSSCPLPKPARRRESNVHSRHINQRVNHHNPRDPHRSTDGFIPRSERSPLFDDSESHDGVEDEVETGGDEDEEVVKLWEREAGECEEEREKREKGRTVSRSLW